MESLGVLEAHLYLLLLSFVESSFVVTCEIHKYNCGLSLAP